MKRVSGDDGEEEKLELNKLKLFSGSDQNYIDLDRNEGEEERVFAESRNVNGEHVDRKLICFLMKKSIGRRAFWHMINILTRGLLVRERRLCCVRRGGNRRVFIWLQSTSRIRGKVEPCLEWIMELVRAV